MFNRMKLISISGVAMASTMVLGLAANAVLPPAQAAVGICRSDPVFNLSNGITVTLYETVTDDPSDITGGAYQLHVPTGVSVMSVDYGGALGQQQSFSYFADQPGGSYSASSTLLTTTPSVPVTAYMTIGAGWVFRHGQHFSSHKRYNIQVQSQGDVESTSTAGVSNTPILNSINYSFNRKLYIGKYDAAASGIGTVVINDWHGNQDTFAVTANTVFMQGKTVVTNPTLADGQWLFVAANKMTDGSLDAILVNFHGTVPPTNAAGG